MKEAIFLLAGLSLGLTLRAQSSRSGTAVDAGHKKPRLVVGIVVDQMRWDYLRRYEARYGQEGFGRLQREGFSFDDCRINYLPAVTAAGHAALFTGSVPALNGIVGNDFYVEGTLTYCTSDPTVCGVGTASAQGAMSPRHLLPTTVTDELRMATHFRSRVIGVSLKDRAAILPAGHAANAAYWYDTDSMRFVTSSYYMERLPEWVMRFNQTHLATGYLAGQGELLYPAHTYYQSEPIDTLSELYVGGDIRYTPAGNTYTLDMACAAIEGEQLGKGSDLDFLTINLASTDYIGHSYGPDSPWVEDAYLRLDRDLATFLHRLDELVGRGQYLLFLTADHGGSHNVLYRQRHRLPSMLYEPEKVQASLDSLLWRLDPKADGVRLVRSMNAYQVHLDDRRLDSLQIDLTAAIAAVCRYLESQPWMAYAFDLRHMPDYVPEPIRQMAVNGYNPQRGGDIQLILQSGATKAYKPGALRLKGAEHAVWNPDDTHIPFILMGCGIRPGADGQVCYITDIAPTISMLLGIQRPSAAVGQSLLERVCE